MVRTEQSVIAPFIREIGFLEETNTLSLCEICQKINSTSSHQPSYKALVASAATCELCKLFLQVMLEEHKHGLEKSIQDVHQCFESTDSLCTVAYIGNKIIFNTGHKCNKYPEVFMCGLSDPNWGWGRKLSFSLRGLPHESSWDPAFEPQPRLRYQDNDADRQHHQPDRVIGVELLPFANFDVARCWIQECCGKHPECTNDVLGPPLLPTRVIDVSNGEPRLVTSRDLKANYVTLSHCWGKSQPLVTNSETIDQHMKAIPFKSLPKTFQDAVTATRQLGYSYLWIDSLCIIQDSSDDWEIECSRMADVYRNATVTIVGAAAGDCHAGFLQRRIPTQPRPDLVKWKDNPRKLAIRWDRHQGPRVCDQISPLEKRGWILQERLLSPRVLYFGAHRMYWNCNTSEWFEDCSLTKPKKGKSTKRNFSVQKDPKYKFNTWCKIVEEYSTLSLTNSVDKLPAVSGIANWFLRGNKEGYLAGIMKDDLHLGLMWHVDTRHGAKLAMNCSIYRAPSWSWASVDQPVSFFGTGRGTYPGQVPSSTLKLIEAQVHVAGKDEFGKIVSGWLKVEGKMKIATASSQYLNTYEFDVNQGFTFALYPDRLGQNMDHLYCLCIHEEGGGFKGLALVPFETDSTKYRRVGCFFFSSSTNYRTVPWFSDAKRCQFELV